MQVKESELYIACIERRVPPDKRKAVRHTLRLKFRNAPDEFGELRPPDNDRGIYFSKMYGGGNVWYGILYQVSVDQIVLWSLSVTGGQAS